MSRRALVLVAVVLGIALLLTAGCGAKPATTTEATSGTEGASIEGTASAESTGTVPSDTPTLIVTVVKKDAAALPADALLTVKLVDATKADAPAVVSEKTVYVEKGLPVDVTLGYEAKKISPDGSYTVQARISDMSGKQRYGTTQAYPVLTKGAPVGAIAVEVTPTP